MSSTESNSSTSGRESPAQQRTIKSGGQGMIEVVKSAYEAAENAHAIVICTEWDEFKDDQLDYNKIYEKMEKPAFIFDGRKILNHEALIKLGFHVETIGKRLTQYDHHQSTNGNGSVAKRARLSGNGHSNGHAL